LTLAIKNTLSQFRVLVIVQNFSKTRFGGEFAIVKITS